MVLVNTEASWYISILQRTLFRAEHEDHTRQSQVNDVAGELPIAPLRTNRIKRIIKSIPRVLM